VAIVKERVPARPEWFTEKISLEKTRCICFGGDTSAFRLATIITKKTTLSAAVVHEALEKICGKKDSELTELPQPELAVAKLALLLGIWQKLEIPSFEYFFANGNTNGILIYENFWK
jgi:hypothetical protein